MPPGSSPVATESLALCEAADDLTADGRSDTLERGLALAEQALEIDEHDGRAHFAFVCNLGKQMEAAGIGFGQLVKLRRVRRSADAALSGGAERRRCTGRQRCLASASAAVGSAAIATRRSILLRRAVAAEPENGTARCYLSQALNARGADDEARALQAHC